MYQSSSHLCNLCGRNDRGDDGGKLSHYSVTGSKVTQGSPSGDSAAAGSTGHHYCPPAPRLTAAKRLATIICHLNVRRGFVRTGGGTGVFSRGELDIPRVSDLLWIVGISDCILEACFDLLDSITATFATCHVMSPTSTEQAVQAPENHRQLN